MGLMIPHPRRHLVAVPQIDIATTCDQYVTTLGLKPPDKGTADHAAMSGNPNTLTAELICLCHVDFLSVRFFSAVETAPYALCAVPAAPIRLP